MQTVITTDLALPNRRRGKVRDVYDLPPGWGGELDSPPAILIIATDRLSAFDVVLPTPIPGKGRLLTEISARWFRFIQDRGLAHTHIVSNDPRDIRDLSEDEWALLAGRSTIARKCRVIPVECVARGYVAGSGWSDYERTGEICGVKLPSGLRRGDSLFDRADGPIFTPATKAAIGEHDENISYERACEIAGPDVMARLRQLTLSIYEAAHKYALERGLILADTKFEFGVPISEEGEPMTGEPMLIDEALTPDSSRYWPADDWTPGREQESFDKQYVREYLLELIDDGDWDKTAPGPTLPEEVVRNTIQKYQEARDRLVG